MRGARGTALRLAGPGRRLRSVQVVAAVKARSAKNVCCSKTLKAKETDIDKVLQLVKEVEQHSLETMKDRSSGVLVFQCVRDRCVAPWSAQRVPSPAYFFYNKI